MAPTRARNPRVHDDMRGRKTWPCGVWLYHRPFQQKRTLLLTVLYHALVVLVLLFPCSFDSCRCSLCLSAWLAIPVAALELISLVRGGTGERLVQVILRMVGSRAQACGLNVMVCRQAA